MKIVELLLALSLLLGIGTGPEKPKTDPHPGGCPYLCHVVNNKCVCDIPK
jgi:hypothetical protein